jgi:cytochrome c553
MKIVSPLFLLAGMLGSPTVKAQPAGEAPPKPSRLGLCVACHGVDGRSTTPGTPHLAGQDQTYLRLAMQQYRDGGRDHATMRSILNAVPRAELDQLAAYYAALPAQGKESAQ